MDSTSFSSDPRRTMHEQNRRSWNEVTPVHNDHKADQATFFRGGGSTLFPDEIELLGEVSGQRLVHMQCNCGQDTLSLARLGAEVTGVDISDAAIAFARNLSSETGIPATFLREDLFDWFEQTEERFDVAFTTYGGIGWLCDLSRWARGVSDVLLPGGRLILLEFHPLVWSFDKAGQVVEPYFIADPLEEPNGVNDYIGSGLAPSGFVERAREFTNPEKNYAFQWTVAQIVQALIDAKLELEIIREYPYANGCELIEGMKPLPGNRFGMPASLPPLPLMLGLSARKP